MYYLYSIAPPRSTSYMSDWGAMTFMSTLTAVFFFIFLFVCFSVVEVIQRRAGK